MESESLRFHAVAKVTEISLDEPKRIVVGEQAIALYNLDGQIHATDDVCSHGLASLSMGLIDGELIECPLHGGAFEIATGKAARAPCMEDIRSFPVRVTDGTVFVGL
jgi:nitrite reductase/ring-hydroxylating ferredoxin subunit